MGLQLRSNIGAESTGFTAVILDGLPLDSAGILTEDLVARALLPVYKERIFTVY